MFANQSSYLIILSNYLLNFPVFVALVSILWEVQEHHGRDPAQKFNTTALSFYRENIKLQIEKS